MKIGNTSFNVESLSRMTKSEFIARYAGKLNSDVNKAAESLSEYFKEEVISEVNLVIDEEEVTMVYNEEIAEKKYRKRK